MSLPIENQRVKEVIIFTTKGNELQFSKEIGVSQPRINRLFTIDKRSGKYPLVSFEIIQAIINKFVNINSEWLLTGKGSMLKEEETKKAALQDLPAANDELVELLREKAVMQEEKITLLTEKATMLQTIIKEKEEKETMYKERIATLEEKLYSYATISKEQLKGKSKLYRRMSVLGKQSKLYNDLVPENKTIVIKKRDEYGNSTPVKTFVINIKELETLKKSREGIIKLGSSI